MVPTNPTDFALWEIVWYFYQMGWADLVHCCYRKRYTCLSSPVSSHAAQSLPNPREPLQFTEPAEKQAVQHARMRCVERHNKFGIWALIWRTRQWCDVNNSVPPSHKLYATFSRKVTTLREHRGFCIWVMFAWVEVIVHMQQEVDSLGWLMPLQLFFMHCWIFCEPGESE